MYLARYQEAADDDGNEAREREYEAFTLMIQRLEAVRDHAPASKERRETIALCAALWRFLINDLREDDNALPQALRADLISLGLWVIRQTEMIQSGNSVDWDEIIDIHRQIRDGLS